jgi:hypothetical protein
MAIHHATQNKAIENNVTLDEHEDGTVTATHKPTGQEATEKTAKKALELVLKHVEENAEEGEEPEEGESSEDAEGEDSEEGTGEAGVVKKKYKDKYKKLGGQSNGDNLASELTAALKDDDGTNWKKVCKENDIDPKQWEHLKNNGLRRMCLRNVLSARVKKGEVKVTVLGIVVDKL